MVSTTFQLGYQIWRQGGLCSLVDRVGLSLSYEIRSINQYMRHRFYLRNWRGTDIDPRKIIYVDPNEINQETRTKMGDVLNEPSVVCGGRWDTAISSFRNRYKVRSLIQHFEKGVDWEATEYYQRLKPRVEAGLSWRGCTSAGDLREYLSKYDQLYETIRDDGYELSSKLIEEDTGDRPAVASELTEIGVNIGRNGELLWQSRGQHRLCIAQLLELDKIPVQVLTRHEEWYDIRDEIRSSRSPEELSGRAGSHLSHPDLEYLQID